MREESLPAARHRHLAERLDRFPPGARTRRWVLRDDNQQHYHGVVNLSSSPVYLELRWKPDAAGPEQLVGLFRLHLPELLASGFARFETEHVVGDKVRLRFYRGAGGVVFIQTRGDEEGLPIGRVHLGDPNAPANAKSRGDHAQ